MPDSCLSAISAGIKFHVLNEFGKTWMFALNLPLQIKTGYPASAVNLNI